MIITSAGHVIPPPPTVATGHRDAVSRVSRHAKLGSGRPAGVLVQEGLTPGSGPRSRWGGQGRGHQRQQRG